MIRKKAKLDQFGQADQVTQRLKTEPPGLARERLLAVSHGLKGELTLREIAGTIGRSRATIQTWFDLFRSGGSRTADITPRPAAVNASLFGAKVGSANNAFKIPKETVNSVPRPSADLLSIIGAPGRFPGSVAKPSSLLHKPCPPLTVRI